MDGERTARSEAAALVSEHARRGVERPRPATGRPKTFRWMVVMAVLAAFVLGSLYAFNRFREHAIANFFARMKPPPAEISAVVAKVQSMPRYVAAIGSLTAMHQVTVSPEVGGRVTKILFKSGQRVKAGDLLVQIDDAPERADLANYEAQAQLAKITLARSKRLVGPGYTPQQTVDQNQAALDEAEAQIAKTKAVIAQKSVRAPFSGDLGIRQINLGQYLKAGDPIVSLTDLSTLYIDFTLPSQVRSEVSVGQRVDVTADAFPGRTFHARITTVEPQVNPETRLITVQAEMANPDDLLLPGMFVNAAVVLPSRPDTVVLPRIAVDYTLYGDSVYIVRKTGQGPGGKPILKAFRTAVKTGREWDDNVAILSGVKPGEQVVAGGQVKIHDGSEVEIGGPPPQPPAHPTLH